METVTFEMELGKEGKEVIDAIALLVKHFKGGGDVAGATQYLGQVAKAIDGVSGVVEELKSDYNDELAAYMVTQLWSALK